MDRFVKTNMRQKVQAKKLIDEFVTEYFQNLSPVLLDLHVFYSSA